MVVPVFARNVMNFVQHAQGPIQMIVDPVIMEDISVVVVDASFVMICVKHV